MLQTFALSILLLPLAMAVVLRTTHNRSPKFVSLLSGSVFLLNTTLAACACYHYIEPIVFRWTEGLGATGFLSFSISLDRVALFLLFIVQLITACVSWYSTAYLQEEPRFNSYFAQLSFFNFAMTGLLLCSNLLTLYIFWELVGFASYLLIGFWNTKTAAVLANKKAFIINRIGDACLLAGIFLLYAQYHSFELSVLCCQGPVATGTCIILMMGAFAKSAQFPLHTWLPDAMEGPTPVSALIHAATMVAAGVYLLIRLFPLFNPDALLIIAVLGSFTAFMAASIALVQNDMKKVLAFSTISQLGLMVSAIGLGSPDAALVHLGAHAFFKCLLFLSVGMVIKAAKEFVKDPQDLLQLGGLRKQLPITFYCYSLAALALIGAPFTSGFLSKDLLLADSFQASSEPFHYLCIALQWSTTLLTTLYIFRQWYLVFVAPTKTTTLEGASEKHRSMQIPMLVLAVGCLSIPFALLPLQSIPPIGSWLLPIATTLSSLVLIFFALHHFKKTNDSYLAKGPLQDFLIAQWQFNALYDRLLVTPIVHFSIFCRSLDSKGIDGIVHGLSKGMIALAAAADWTDRVLVDGLINSIAGRTQKIGKGLLRMQSGKIQWYIAISLYGIILLYCLLF